MATKTIVLEELGNVVVQAAKVVKKPGTPTQERTRWMKVLVEASQAYAAVAKAGEKAGK
jgi:hypothetical protein